MTNGYVGQKAKKRTRKKYLFLIFFILIVFLIYISFQEFNSEVSNKEIIKVEEENIPFEDQSFQLKKLETTIIEYKQRIQLRDQLIVSIKEQLVALEKSNSELIESIKMLNLEKNNNNISLENLQQRIKELKKQTQKQNDTIVLSEEKKMELSNKIINLNNEIQMLNNNVRIINNKINEIILQKNDLLSQVDSLNNNIVERDEIIKNLKDKIHH